LIAQAVSIDYVSLVLFKAAYQLSGQFLLKQIIYLTSSFFCLAGILIEIYRNDPKILASKSMIALNLMSFAGILSMTIKIYQVIKNFKKDYKPP